MELGSSIVRHGAGSLPHVGSNVQQLCPSRRQLLSRTFSPSSSENNIRLHRADRAILLGQLGIGTRRRVQNRQLAASRSTSNGICRSRNSSASDSIRSSKRRTVNLPGIQRRQPPADPLQQPAANFRVLDLANLLPRARSPGRQNSLPPGGGLFGQCVPMDRPAAAGSLRRSLNVPWAAAAASAAAARQSR